MNVKLKNVMLAVGLLLTGIGGAEEASRTCSPVPRVKLGDAIADGRPSVRWRGFNLLDMFIMGSNPVPDEFKEWDFRKISEWGFNFVRLPMDYRFWVKDGKFENWDVFVEEHLQHVDRAIALGRKYGVHVMLNLHRAPGYTVCKAPKEPADLFTSAEAQRVCARHWAMFARRYRGIPNSALSFNLFNEPPSAESAGTNYVKVIRLLEAAIHAEDPARFIVADGYGYGRHPIDGAFGLPHVGQSLHNYEPMRLTHANLSYVGQSSRKPPLWPISVNATRSYFGGPGKPKIHVPWIYRDLPPGTFEIQFDKVSSACTVEAKADGRLLETRTFAPSTNDVEWTGVKYFPQWKLFNGTWEGTWRIDLPQGAKALSLYVTKGDWIDVHNVIYRPRTGVPRRIVYGCHELFAHLPGTTLDWTPEGFVSPEAEGRRYADDGREYLYRTCFREWDGPIRDGLFLFMGEFGVTAGVANATALAHIRDNLALCKERNMGWAMWRLHGGMGLVDNKRADADQVTVDGHTVDRGLLKLLQAY